ncbi:MAG TPA: serine hydrolase, partial [Anaerolineales bacterium]|nr:serine hydrolase [Anaerolineales bacterium]
EQLVMGKPTTSYGMGWFINEIDGVTIIAHGGNVPHFSAYMALIPEQDKGVVILANSDQWGLPFILMEVGDGVAALLAGKQPAPIKLAFLPWVMRALPLLPLFQSGRIFFTLNRLHSWRQNPTLRPIAARAVAQDILPALIPNLSLAAILNYLRTSGLLRFMRLYMPDLAFIAQVSGGLAGIWAVVRTVLILRLLRKVE